MTFFFITQHFFSHNFFNIFFLYPHVFGIANILYHNFFLSQTIFYHKNFCQLFFITKLNFSQFFFIILFLCLHKKNYIITQFIFYFFFRSTVTTVTTVTSNQCHYCHNIMVKYHMLLLYSSKGNFFTKSQDRQADQQIDFKSCLGQLQIMLSLATQHTAPQKKLGQLVAVWSCFSTYFCLSVAKYKMFFRAPTEAPNMSK